MSSRHMTGADEDIYFQITRSFKDFIRMLAELISNETDWRVKGSKPEIRVRFFREGGRNHVEVVGQGQGADTTDGRRNLIRLGGSSARGNATMRGDKGSGAKGGPYHCEEVVIETVSTPGKIANIAYTIERLLEWNFRGRDYAPDWKSATKPVRHPVRTTGTRILLRGLGEGKFQYRGKPLVRPSGTDTNQEDRSPERVVRELAECLPPNVDRFITVEDYDGKEHKLQVRKLEGEPIIGSAQNVPGVGDIAWDMAVVANRHASDVLKIGALGTYITWHEFVRLIRGNRRNATLLAQLDDFRDPLLAGTVEASRMNDYRAPSSNSFEADIANDEALVEGILITLIDRVQPAVRKALNVDARRATSDQGTFLAELVHSIQDATGVKPQGPTRKVKVTARHTHLTLEPGETQEIDIQVDPSVRVVWDTSRAGGTLNTPKGAKVDYTAGKKCGEFVLVARDATDATRVLYEVTIEIVAEIPFEFSRAVYRMDVNDRIRVSIDERAVAHTSGDIVIALATDQPDGSPGGMRMEHKKGEAEGFVSSSSHTGYVDIVAYDRHNPRKFSAKTKVSVEKDLRNQPKGNKSTLDIAFVYDGREYELAVAAHRGSVEALRQISYLTPGASRNTITLNLDHPLFDGKADPVRREASLLQIAMRIAEDRLPPEVLFDEIIQEAGVVYATITKAT